MPPPPWAEIMHNCNIQKLKGRKDEKTDDSNLDLSEKQQFETCYSFQNVQKGNEPNEYENFETDDEEEPAVYSPKSLKKIERQDEEYVDRDETVDEESITSDSDDVSSPIKDDEFLHMWVVIRKGRRDIRSTLCVDACTGRIFEPRNCPYLKVEAIVNHKQFWVNMQDPEKNARYRAVKS